MNLVLTRQRVLKIVMEAFHSINDRCKDIEGRKRVSAPRTENRVLVS